MSPAGIIALLLLGLACCKPGNAQDPRPHVSHHVAFVSDGDSRNEFVFPSGVRGLSVSTDGRLWITTGQNPFRREEHLFVADSLSADWKPATPDGSSLQLAVSIEQIHFFDSQRAIAIGPSSTPIGEICGAEEASSILRTTDAGASWEQVAVPPEGLLYTAMVTPDGHAWIGGSEGKFSHSSDYGKTWRARTPPFDNVIRTRAIAMRSPTSGFVAGLDNGLRQTSDGGKTWRALKTPLDQKLLPPSTYYNSSGRMQYMALVGNYLVLHQGGRSFVTDIGKIRWKPAPVELSIFPNGVFATSLAGVDSDGYVVSIDTALRVTRLAPEPLSAEAGYVAVNGADVYVLDENNFVCRISRGAIDCRYPMSSTATRPEFEQVTKRGDIWWGATRHHLYRSHTDTAGWYRVGSLPMAILGMEARNGNEVILHDHQGRNYEFRFDSKTFYRIPRMDSLDVSGMQRRGSRWIAYGGGQASRGQDFPDSSAQERYRKSVSWSHPHGFVLVSNDSGRTWEQADEWVGESIRMVVFAPEGNIHLLSHSGTFRSINIDGRTPVTTVAAAQTGAPAGSQHQELFLRGRRGWLVSYFHEERADIRATSDGGSTWFAADSAEYIGDIHPFRDGFLGRRNGDIVYVTADSIRILALPLVSEAGSSTSIHPIDDNHLLLEMREYDPPFGSSRTSWKELVVP